jgi:hypothetical protein
MGNFLIQKRLFYVNTPPSSLTTNTSNNNYLLTAYAQILNYAISKMQNAGTAATLQAQLTNFNPCDNAYAPVNIDPNTNACYVFPSDFTVNLTTVNSKSVIQIQTNCCGTMNIPNGIGGAQKYNCSDFTTLSNYANNGSMDLTSYLVKSVTYQITQGGATAPSAATILNNFLPGYGDPVPSNVDPNATGVSQLNYMVYLMLNDKYYTGRTINIGGTLYKLSDDGLTQGVALGQSDLTTHYSCDDIWRCWMNNVSSLNTLIKSLADQYPTNTTGSAAWFCRWRGRRLEF